ncbi:leucine-rich repeat domain-containing protein, partial [Treponema sp.]|uniref:leucine-rich repeat domain-containing protein n=1 Tax=Treponema sp. TaxID=166 RepID=UPI00298DB358
ISVLGNEELPVNHLEFIRCPKLEDLEEFPSKFPNLTYLKFDHCKNIKDYSPLAKLKNLEELHIFESAPIADFSFLREMEKLSSVRIFKTKVIASDTTILDEIPAKVELCLTD